MNQKLLGALRGIGIMILFVILSAVIGAIPDVLTQLPYIGTWITPALAGVITTAAAVWEHKLADAWGYNLPAGTVKVAQRDAIAKGVQIL